MLVAEPRCVQFSAKLTNCLKNVINGWNTSAWYSWQTDNRKSRFLRLRSYLVNCGALFLVNLSLWTCTRWATVLTTTRVCVWPWRKPVLARGLSSTCKTSRTSRNASTQSQARWATRYSWSHSMSHRKHTRLGACSRRIKMPSNTIRLLRFSIVKNNSLFNNWHQQTLLSSQKKQMTSFFKFKIYQKFKSLIMDKRT